MDAEAFATVTVKIHSSIVDNVVASIGNNHIRIRQELLEMSSSLQCWQEGESWYISGCFNNIAEARTQLLARWQPETNTEDNSLDAGVSRNEFQSAVHQTRSTGTGNSQKQPGTEMARNEDGVVGGAKSETMGMFKLLLLCMIYFIRTRGEYRILERELRV